MSMTGFEPGPSGVGIDHSANRSTPAAPQVNRLFSVTRFGTGI